MCYLFSFEFYDTKLWLRKIRFYFSHFTKHVYYVTQKKIIIIIIIIILRGFLWGSVKTIVGGLVPLSVSGLISEAIVGLDSGISTSAGGGA